jgi:hypothetical protein
MIISISQFNQNPLFSSRTPFCSMVNDTVYIKIQSNSDIFKSNPILFNGKWYFLYQHTIEFRSFQVKSYLSHGKWYFLYKKQCRIFHVKTNRFNGNWYCLYQNIVKLKFLSVQVKSLLFNGKWYFLNQNVVKLSFPVRSHLLNETFYIKKKSSSYLFKSNPIFSVVNDTFYIKIPVVPHKAVAEVSKIGNL